MYPIEIISSAEKSLRKINPCDKKSIVEEIMKLSDNPRPQNCKKLIGSDFFRIRIGDYMVIYLIDDKEHFVVILRIGHRSEIYEH